MIVCNSFVVEAQYLELENVAVYSKLEYCTFLRIIGIYNFNSRSLLHSMSAAIFGVENSIQYHK